MSPFMISEPLNNNSLKHSPFSNINQSVGRADHDLTTYVSSNCLDLLLYIHTDHMESSTPSCIDGWGDQRVGQDDHDLTTYVSSNCLDLLLYIHTDHMESATPSCTDGWGDQQVGDDHDHELKAYVSTNCLNLLLYIHIDHMEYSTPSVLIIENFKKFAAVTSKENHKTLQKNHSTRFKLN